MSRAPTLLIILCCLLGQTVATAWDESQLEGLKWREIGPYRGGRSAAVAGIPQDRETFYFVTTATEKMRSGTWGTLHPVRR